MATNDNLFREALNFIPGGVNSPVRAFKAVGGTPVFFKRAEGQYLFDTEGNRYLDLVGSWGPMILGHAHPLVVEAVKEAAGRSFCFGTPTEIETEVAKHILGLVPCIDKIRMVNSGTEACMSAIRLARGVTGRNKIIKFIGGYHGHGDSFLKQTGSGVSTFSLQDSPGIPSALTDLTLLAPYNDSEAVESLVRDNAGEIAAIIVEPVAGNMGCIPPVDGFLSSLRAIADKQNILLIFDEVMTGFRVAKAGAIQRYGIIPDIVSYGKIIGGGLPVGAFGAKKELMDQLAPDGPIYQAGTMSGNPLAMTAGLTTLKILDEEPMIYQRLEKLGAYLEKGIMKYVST